jgi:hypothetical protein
MAALVELRLWNPRGTSPSVRVPGVSIAEPSLSHRKCRIVNRSSPCAAPCTEQSQSAEPGPETALTIAQEGTA